MRTIGEYLQRAAEFDQLAADTRIESLKKRYSDLAACYRMLAAERKRLVAEGVAVDEQG